MASRSTCCDEERRVQLTRSGKILLLKGHVLAGGFGGNGVHSDALVERLNNLQHLASVKRSHRSIQRRAHRNIDLDIPLDQHASPGLC